MNFRYGNDILSLRTWNFGNVDDRVSSVPMDGWTDRQYIRTHQSLQHVARATQRVKTVKWIRDWKILLLGNYQYLQEEGFPDSWAFNILVYEKNPHNKMTAIKAYHAYPWRTAEGLVSWSSWRLYALCNFSLQWSVWKSRRAVHIVSCLD